ncbi:MAG TPA: CesT family type III secretion system chaperone [Ramlibacter sp.]|nr:CesT family type III secretion system chaperone [Ramlibacter sp.]
MTESGITEDHVLVNHWLRGLNAKTGLHLRLNDQGVCAVGHASGLDCAIEVPDGRGVAYLRIPLMPWAGSPSTLAEYCLTEHFMGINTEGAAFAIDREERELVLWTARRLSSMDEQRLGRLLVELFDTAVRWKVQLEEFCRGQTADTGAHDAREPSFVKA